MHQDRSVRVKNCQRIPAEVLHVIVCASRVVELNPGQRLRIPDVDGMADKRWSGVCDGCEPEQNRNGADREA